MPNAPPPPPHSAFGRGRSLTDCGVHFRVVRGAHAREIRSSHARRRRANCVKFAFLRTSNCSARAGKRCERLAHVLRGIISLFPLK